MDISEVNNHAKTLDGVRRTAWRLESHMKVLADLRRGDADAIRDAVTAAWELQRRA